MTHNNLVTILLPHYGDLEQLDNVRQQLTKQTYQAFDIIILDYSFQKESKKEAFADKLTISEEQVSILPINRQTAITQEVFKLAKGEYLVILNHLDELGEAFLEKALNSGRQFQSDIVLLETCTFDENNGNYYFYEKLFHQEQLKEADILSVYDYSPHHKKHLMSNHAKCFKLDYLRTHHLDFTKDLTADFYKTNRISYITEISYTYKKLREDLISIIVPVYNVENYLRECLDSLIQQSYKNLEIILVNDGSSDGSGEICDEYAQKDSRIKAIHKENSGVSDTRNIGLKTMTGDYLMFMDSDDMLQHDAIEILHHYLKTTDSDISICSYYAFSREDNGDFNMYFYDLDDNPFELLSSASACTRQIIHSYNETLYIVVWGKLIKKQVIENAHFPNLTIFEDEATIHKWFLNANKIVQVNNMLYMYRNNYNGITKSKFKLTNVDGLTAAYDEKIADFVMAGIDVTNTIAKYLSILHHYTKVMESQNYIDTPQYRKVIQKLHQYNKFKQ